MKINLGSGGTRLPDFVSVDLYSGDVKHDLSEYPWPFEDEAADVILASHILEHFTREQGKQFLAECYRILKQGGLLSLAVPDMDLFIDAKLTGEWDRLGGYVWTDLNDFLGGGLSEPREEQRHSYMYTWGSLAWMLKEEGFIPERKAFDTCSLGDVHTRAYKAISLYVDAVKP